MTGPKAAQQARLLLLAPQDMASDQLVSDLAAEGYHVGHVAGIADALTAIDTESADGILVVEQRGDPSFGLSAKLDARRTARASGVALVALTDDAEPATVLAGLAAGADDVVSRGRDGDMLLVRIRAIVRRKLAHH